MGTNQRVVLVTGATGGLGPAVVDAFLKTGATVVAVSKSGGGGRDGVIPVAADLTTAAGVELALRRALQPTGTIDALAHVLGGFQGGDAIAATTDETWNAMMELNLTAAFRVIRGALGCMKSGGRIIAVGSRSGAAPSANVAAYSVSKAGLHALVQCAAAEAKMAGITVNAVMPSVIDTPSNRAANPGADYSVWVAPAAIAELITWLTSPEAGQITGALIPVYGRA